MSNESKNRQRLLIVDDSKVIRVTARKILQDHFETVEAVDGNNAWEILNSEAPFSLIVSDLTMPGMDGFELLSNIRGSHNPQISKVPVIVITGANDSEPTKQRATEAGATDFIGKPFDAEHLLARTHAYADAFETATTLTESNMALEDQALVDPLSGLPNESAFIERGGQMVAYAGRHESTLALFSIDIDGYRDLHDTSGESGTTAAVKTLAGVLNNCLRQEDIAARVGSSRFALLLPGLSNTGIRNLADRIIADLSQACASSDQIPFTVSIGVVAPDSIGTLSLNDLLTDALRHLQAAAHRGGNCAVFTSGTAESMPSETPVMAAAPAQAGEPATAAAPPPAEPSLVDAVASMELTLEPVGEPAVEAHDAAEEIEALAAPAEDPMAIVIEQMPDLEQVGTAEFHAREPVVPDAAQGSIHLTAPGEPADTGSNEPVDETIHVKIDRAAAELGEEPEPRKGFFARLFSIFTRR